MKIFHQPVVDKAIAATGATMTASPSPFQTNDGFQSGDLLARSLRLTLRGNLNLATSSAGTVIANAALKNLRAITIKTDKHQALIDGIDGLGLFRINQFMRKSKGVTPTDPSAATTGTPSFLASLEIPFYAPGLFTGLNVQTNSQGAAVAQSVEDFGNDSRLDMFKSRMSLIAQFGPVTDYISGGTYTTEEIQNLNLSVLGVNEYPVGGSVSMKDKPNSILSIEMFKVPITATATGWTYDLPYGDRIYSKILISQRNLSTFAELDNSVITATGKIGLSVNNVNFFPDVYNLDLQADNSDLLAPGLAMPAGWTVLDFSKTGKKSEMLNTIGQSTGKVTLKADVTTGSNYGLYIYVVSFKDIPRDAQRADAEYAA